MKITWNYYIVFAIGIVTLAVGGCATKPTDSNPLAQCQIDINKCDDQRRQCLGSCDKLTTQLSLQVRKNEVKQRELVESNKRVSDARQALLSCQRRSTQTGQRVQSLESAKTELEKQLTDSIAQKDVQIELLNDRLSVRVLNRILFDSGSAKIQGRGIQVLGKVAKVLGNGSDFIRIEGHTDNIPISAGLRHRYQTNWDLSAARAISVVRLFQNEYEIAPIRMEAVGHSFYRPVSSNDSEQQRQLNRRVEVVLTAPKR